MMRRTRMSAKADDWIKRHAVGTEFKRPDGNLSGKLFLCDADAKCRWNATQQFFGDTLGPMEQALVGSDGKVYGVPYHEDMLVMYYLTDALTKAGISKPPTTWDELVVEHA